MTKAGTQTELKHAGAYFNRNDLPRACDHILESREFGGAGMVALQLACYLRQRGVISRVWLPGPGPASTAFEEAGVPWLPLGVDHSTASSLRRLLGCLRLWRGLAGRGRILHIHSPMMYGLLSYGLGPLRTPTVVHMHLEPNTKGMQWAFQKLPDMIMPCATFMVDSIVESLGKHAKGIPIVPIPNAVDTKIFFPGDKLQLKRELQASLTRPLLLVVGNLSPHKGQHTAIRTVSRLRELGITVECWLVGKERGGGDEYQRKLMQLAESLDVRAQVHFLGYREDVALLVRAADCLLLPSTHEGLPLSILEAQASKTVVLAAPTAGIPEVVKDDCTGYLIDADDAFAYAHRIAILLKRPDKYAQLAEQALQLVKERHTWPAYCESVAAAYAIARSKRCSTNLRPQGNYRSRPSAHLKNPISSRTTSN